MKGGGAGGTGVAAVQRTPGCAGPQGQGSCTQHLSARDCRAQQCCNDYFVVLLMFYN